MCKINDSQSVRLERATGLGPWTVALHSLRGPGRRTYRLVRCILSSFRRRFTTIRRHGRCQHYIGTRSTRMLLRCGQTLVPGKLSAVERRQVRRHGHFCSAEVRRSRNHRRRCRQLSAGRVTNQVTQAARRHHQQSSALRQAGGSRRQGV